MKISLYLFVTLLLSVNGRIFLNFEGYLFFHKCGSGGTAFIRTKAAAMMT